MAYNNFGNYGGPQQGFQQNFQQQTTPQPQFPQQMQAQFPQQMQPQPLQQFFPPRANTFDWVPCEEAVLQYPVAPGNSVLLINSEMPVQYVKARDPSGRYYPIEVYDIIKREPGQPVQPTQQAQQQIIQPDLSQYVKLEDLDTILSKKVQEAVDKALAS